MHLTSLNVTGASAGTITVTLEDDGFDKLDATWISRIGGVTSGTVDSSTYIDGALVASYTGTGAFSNTQSGQVNALAPYAIKLVVHHAHRGRSGFEPRLRRERAGTGRPLADGAGLLALAFVRRRRTA